MTEPPDPAAADRADVALLQRIWGIDEPDARELLHASGMNIELAVDAWLEAGEQVVKARGSHGFSQAERKAIALRWAREHR